MLAVATDRPLALQPNNSNPVISTLWYSLALLLALLGCGQSWGSTFAAGSAHTCAVVSGALQPSRVGSTPHCCPRVT